MPSRMLRDSMKLSRKINNLSDFQFRVWIHLILTADDYGRGYADPELVKTLAFPRRKRVTEKDIHDALTEMAGTGCILLYEADGESYFCFPNWASHQRIQTKVSRFPGPSEEDMSRWLTVNHGEIPLETKPSEKRETKREDARAEDGFDAFWEAYPRKTNRDKARHAWEKLHPDAELQRLILAAIEEQRHSSQWTRDNGEYIPHPSTWLNGHRWEDKLAPARGRGYQQNSTSAYDLDALMDQLKEDI